MEEIDNIIIHSLRQIGCNIDEDVTNLAGFNTELVVEAAVRCLDVIRPGLGLSTTLPANMAARFRLGAALAQACSELGYRGDIGYQTFLYNAEVDVRRLFMFLIEKLPKESDKTIDEPTSRVGLLERSATKSISRDLSTPWLPHYCHKCDAKMKGCPSQPCKTVDLDVSSEENNEECRDYCIHHQKSVADQASCDEYLLPSLISRDARNLQESATNIIERLDWLAKQKGGLPETTYDEEEPMIGFTLNQKPQFSEGVQGKSLLSQEAFSKEEEVATPTCSVEESQTTTQSRDENCAIKIDAAKSECESLRSDVDTLQAGIKQLSVKLSQVTMTLNNEEKDCRIVDENRKTKARVYNLLDDSDENLKKLRATIETSTNKLINLANQWERHRVPLIERYRDERAKYSTKASASRKKINELKSLGEKEKELLEELRNKDQQYAQLLAEVEKLPRDVNRSAYTQRILEIINNVRKQRCEIDKVLADTREIQKDINTFTGRLERSFTVADELIFKDAKTNEASRKAYKLLATLHSDCGELVTLVEETGATVREIRDLEEQIDTESAKNVGANLERITADLKQMKHETATLTAQLQTKNS